VLKNYLFSTKNLHKGAIFISSAEICIIKMTKIARLFCCGHISYETSPPHICKLLLFIESCNYLLFFSPEESSDQSLASMYLVSKTSTQQIFVHFSGYSKSTRLKSLNKNLMIGAGVIFSKEPARITSTNPTDDLWQLAF